MLPILGYFPPVLLLLLPIFRASSLEFDYIIIGAGPSGLTLANRLSELSDITVGVIEAGAEVKNNPNVTDVDKFTVALGTAIDWQYESTDQIYAAGQTIEYHSGKALGGTSTINGMTYVRAEKAQIDSWETIGNKGWNFDSLFPYYLKSEQFDIPTPAQIAAGASYEENFHGEQGPLKVGYSYGLLNGSFVQGVEAAWGELGMPHNPDVNGGQVRGFTVWQSTLDRDANVREDAARAYYYPIQSRPNLSIFLSTTANRVIWKDSTEVTAAGVEVTSANGTVSVIQARKEVILSAGSLRSPALLELSGIGNPDILIKYEITTKVDLPGVGENLQDQPNTVIAFNANTTFNGTMVYVTYGSFPDFLPNPSAANVSGWASTVSNAVNNSISAASFGRLLQIQHDLLEDGVPDAETIIGTTMNFGLGPSGFLASAFWLLMPFSRGNVHIGSSNPLAYPRINPNYFLIDFDLEVQIAIAKWTRKLSETEPLVGSVAEISPGFEVVPENATDAVWGDWIKSSFTANSHPLGTASMMSKELGGVVNDRLKVYGTTNVRVVDASVMPFQVSGHLTSTLYAIAEKAADLIKEDM